jgi:hypothetical protein
MVDLVFGKFAGMAAIVKVEVSANPVDGGLLRAAAIVPDAGTSTMWPQSRGAGWSGNKPKGVRRCCDELVTASFHQ